MTVKSSCFSLLILWMFLGCVIPPSTPNVYQPPTPKQVECPEIEYAWETGEGEANSFFAGAGDFCTSIGPLDTSVEMPLRARCVGRDAAGVVIKSTEWIQARLITLDEFDEFCPREAQPPVAVPLEGE
jgi:hypothetical protein